MSRRLGLLLTLLLGLTFCQSADAQFVPKWPVDAGGTPAPACTTFDPATGITSFCPPVGAALPATNNSTAFGQGFFTGQDPVTLISSGASFLFLDETTVIGVGGRNVGAFNVYRSSDGGRTLTSPTTAGAGAQNAMRNLVRSSNGLYVVGVNDNPGSIQTSRDLGTFTRTAGNGLPGGGPYNTIVYQGGNTILLTEDTTNTICRNVAPATGSFATPWTCTTPAGWTGAQTGANYGVFSLTPGAGAGTATGVWVAVDKASPTANVFRSTNDGVSFTLVATLGEGAAAGGYAHSLVCLRNSTSICLIGLNGNVYRSVDGGVTWALVAVYTYTGLGRGFVDFGNGTVVLAGSVFSANTPPPGCIPSCAASSGLVWARSTDSGATWALIPGGWAQVAGSGTDALNSIATSPTTGRAILSLVKTGQGVPNGFAGSTGYLYGPTLSPQGTSVFGSGGIASAVLDHGEAIAAGTVQAGSLKNTSTTGAATTAVTVTIPGIVGFRTHIYEVSARCNTAAATATVLSITDGGVGIWSAASSTAQIVAATDFTKRWGAPGLTMGDGNAAVITAGACTAGTTTLQIQADQF